MTVRRDLRLQLLLPVALLAGMVLAWSALPSSRPALTILALNIIFVVGLAIFVSNTGIISFGHVSFLAVGAYVGGLCSIPVSTKKLLLPELPSPFSGLELSVLTSAFLSALLAAAIALLVGIPLLRLSGVAASIATLSLLVITNVVLSNWDSLTGGTGTLTGVPAYTTFPVATASALAAILIAYLYFRSTTARLLRATREDLTAARSIGINPLPHRLGAMALSAFVMAFGGVLYGSYLGSFSPDAFYLPMTFMLLAMLVLGGQFSTGGAVAGACIVSIVTEVFRVVEAGLWVGNTQIAVRPGIGGLVLAALVVSILTLRPDGIVSGQRRRPLRRTLRRQEAVESTTPLTGNRS